MLNIFKFFGQSHAGLGHTDQTLFFPLQIQSINHSISNQSINLLIKVLLVTANNLLGFPGGSVSKESTCNAGDYLKGIRSLNREDPLEKKVATHSSILAWKIPWTKEPGGLQCIGSQRIVFNLETKPMVWVFIPLDTSLVVSQLTFQQCFEAGALVVATLQINQGKAK